LAQGRSPVPPSASPNLIWRMFASQLIIWLAWAALVPVALWFRRRFPLSALRGALPSHLIAIAALCLAHAGIAVWLTRLIVVGGGAPAGPPLAVSRAYSWPRALPCSALFYLLSLA